jgi:hypothetical protein
LHETAGAVGELLEIHFSTPSAHGGTENAAGPVTAACLSALCGCHYRSLKSRIV